MMAESNVRYPYQELPNTGCNATKKAVRGDRPGYWAVYMCGKPGKAYNLDTDGPTYLCDDHKYLAE